MVKFENESVINEYVKAEAEEPSPGELDGDRVIDLSCNNFGHPKSAPGAPKTADFGLAIWSSTADLHHHPIQPHCFRAPEVVLDAGWTYSAVIWNLGAPWFDFQTAIMDPANGLVEVARRNTAVTVCAD